MNLNSSLAFLGVAAASILVGLSLPSSEHKQPNGNCGCTGAQDGGAKPPKFTEGEAGATAKADSGRV